MTRLVVDVENSVTREGKLIDNRPHNSNNSLVSVGVLDIDTQEIDYVRLFHNDMPGEPDKFSDVKKKIEAADLLIGHNIKYD